ncbi:integrin-linked protein kinase 1-like [Alnus glutinosa]|uniref:integrin-linked protein kinase 1-like n=1 Tax=Alnus glutinosa TaxID=3517 RepID=UPI002D78A378|nr:integrin-linked protein kinase 1-like [Alnus glutinosa]
MEEGQNWKTVGGWVWVVGDGAWQYLVAGDGDGRRQWSTVLIRRWGTSSAVALSEMENDGGGLVRKWSPERRWWVVRGGRRWRVVKLLLSRKVSIDARDRWWARYAADAKYYGNTEVYNILKARGAKVPKFRKTPMTVLNPRELPENELNPLELQVRKGDGISKGTYQVAKWNGTKVAVKILDKDSYSDPESINAFKHELTLLEKVRHPNVLQFVGVVTQNKPMMIVSEYHPNVSKYILSPLPPLKKKKTSAGNLHMFEFE